jgi:hypothetical protein
MEDEQGGPRRALQRSTDTEHYERVHKLRVRLVAALKATPSEEGKTTYTSDVLIAALLLACDMAASCEAQELVLEFNGYTVLLDRSDHSSRNPS